MNTGNTDSSSVLSKSERQSQVVRALQADLPSHALIWEAEDTTPYECDGLTAYRTRPLVVALPETEAQIAAVLRTCHRLGVPVVARGAGTGLSGGAMPHALGVTLSLVALEYIPAGVAASITAFFPVLTILIAMRFHDEKPTARLLLGALIAVAGVIILFLR